MAKPTIRRLFYHPAYGGIYVEAKSLAAVKRWGWLEDVTNNPYHEEEYQEQERALNEKRKTAALTKRADRSV